MFALLLLAVFPARSAEEKSKPLTNADVLKMLEHKIPESVILARIQSSAVKFDNSTDAIIELSKKGVTEKILVAIANAKSEPASGVKHEASAPPGAGKAPDQPANPPVADSAGKDRLSGGTVNALVKKGVTTQLELLELFGGPSISTTDKDGTEVWMYDKTTRTTSTSSTLSGKQTRESEASVMAAALGIPFLGGVARAKGKEKEISEGSSDSAGTSSVSIKTVTFIIKFNSNKTVKEYSIRQANF